MRVLVCGGRNYTDDTNVNRVLDLLHSRERITCLINGAALGADSLARAWARLHGVYVSTFPAEWKVWGRAAGPIRNQLMLDEGKPDLIVAFPGKKGTADMIAKARTAGIPVQVEP